MGRVFRALILHELVERTRDRWVLVCTALFALLSVGIAVYGRGAGDAAAVVTAPSLVTLAAFLVPLVALILGHDAIVGERERHTLGLLMSLPVKRWEILVAKYIGRLLALFVSIGLGIGSAAMILPPGPRDVVLQLVLPTCLLGAAFLAVGVLLSSITARVATSASLAVVVWFLLVFFYDLGLLALLVGTDGAVSQETIAWAVSANPAGLYRTHLMVELVGRAAMEDIGLTVVLPGQRTQLLIWFLWIAVPLGLGALLLSRRRAVTS